MSSNKRIAYQGEPGANSHIACRDVYGDWESLPCASFEDAFAAIEDGTAALGMIPIENSIAGRVADIHHFLPNSGLHIVGEYFLPIHFQLLAVKGASLATIKTVYSHVHALGQCRKIIRRYGLKPVIAGDTAGSAREVAEWGDPTRASLASALAAEIYGLETLARDVEDEAHNTTRFVILSKTPDWAACRQWPDGDDVRLPRAERSRRPLQGARRLCHQRRQHDEARKLHGRGRIRRDAISRRCRRPSRRSAGGTRARGTRLLLPRGAHSRRLSRPSLPHRDAEGGGIERGR